MKNIRVLAIILIIPVLLISCENFLDRLPSDKITSSTFFTTSKDLVYAVNAVYDDVAYGGGDRVLRQEILTDNALDNHSWNSLYDMQIGTGNAYDDYIENTWKAIYRGIQRVNRIVEGADGVEDIDADLKARLLAEATVLRAYFYWSLTYLWGDVPYLTSSISPNEALGSYRNDADSILTAEVEDIDAVVDDLPLSYADETGRVTKGAALALKARILLAQKKWVEAANAAKTVMDLEVYELYPKYENLFDYEAINCSEVIFDFQSMEGSDQEEAFLLVFGSQSVGCWTCSSPLQSLVDTYECTDGKTIDESLFYNPDKPYENRDPRLGYSILYPGHEWQGGVYNTIPGATYEGKNIIPGDDLTDAVGEQWNKSYTGYNWLKYISQTDIDESNYSSEGLHFIVIRYAEMLLTYAEAKVEANDIDQSVYDAINEVRARGDVNMPAIETGKTQDEMRTVVRRERRVELAFEALRLFDIRRWKIAEDVIPGIPEGLTYTDTDTGEETMITPGTSRKFDADKDYLWPIPQSEIDVSGIEQNPGWN